MLYSATFLKNMSRFFLVLLLALCFSQQAFSEEGKITISFNNADVLDVIRWAADLTDKNIIVSNKLGNKKITVIAGDPMTRQEAYEAFLAIMQVNDLVVVETDTALKIFPSNIAKDNAIPMMDDGTRSPEDFVINIIKIKNVAAQQLLQLLRPLVPGTAQFQVHTGTNILLIADYKANVEKIVRLVEQIDRAGTIDVEFIQLQHASAKEVVDLISSLVPKIVGADAKDAPAQAFNLAADERSNSILMSGDSVLRSQMKKLIEKLDKPLQGEGNTQVIYLNYSDAKDMAEMLKGISGSVIKSEKDKTTVTSEEVNIVASESNNALIITAPPSLLNTIKGVVEKLDVRREQVLVEALLVEVNEDVGRQLGVMWATSSNQNGRATGIFNAASAESSFSVSDANTDGVLDSVSGVGLLGSYFSSGDLHGVIQTLETMSESNVLSTPTILALDNEEAEILVGENVPFITGERTDASSSSSDTFVSIERQDIGIHLKVKAKINLNNTLTLDIEQKVESVTDSNVAADIITNKRELKTKAIVNDNEILVLGGLIRDESIETESKVPFLGDIPVLGWLFKGTKKTLVKKNLMILIHPKIIRDRTDSVKESVEAYNKMRVLEDYYNENTDWMTIRPDSLPRLKDLPATMLDDGTLKVAPKTSIEMAPEAKDKIIEVPLKADQTIPVEKLTPEAALPQESDFPAGLP